MRERQHRSGHEKQQETGTLAGEVNAGCEQEM